MSKERPKDEESSGSAEHLRYCDLQRCEARCCYDGVYLKTGEEKKIRELVASSPEFFDSLPEEYIVDGFWDGKYEGRKTAIRPYEFKGEDFPAHFTHTRCVFCEPEHYCSLQLLAIERGLHKWAYKPTSCWMFPMRIINEEPAPPPALSEADPDCLGVDYPGFASYTLCGQGISKGTAWGETLVEEVEYWHKNSLKLPR